MGAVVVQDTTESYRSGRVAAFRQHLGQLDSILRLAGEPFDEQARTVLGHTAGLLQCDFIELAISSSTRERERFVQAGVLANRTELPLGWLAQQTFKERAIEPVEGGSSPARAAFNLIGLRFVFFWPFETSDARCILMLGWARQQGPPISEEEIRYLTILADLLAKIIDAEDERRRREARVEQDALTGLPHRGPTLERLEEAISSARRSGSSVAVLYVDLDQFKAVNDTYGHAAGDELLAELAERMRGALRRHETAGRLGGDEFAIIVPGCSTDGDLAGIAQRVLDAVSSKLRVAGRFVRISASVGIAVFPRDAQDVTALLARADQAMYRAKALGPGKYAFCHTPSTSEPPSSFEFDGEAFESQFVLCYQPIVSAQTGKLIAAEALVRWLNTDRGLLPSKDLISALAKRDSLAEFQRRMVVATLKRAPALSQSLGPIAIHVNISEPSDEVLQLSPAGIATIGLEIDQALVAQNPERYAEFAQLSQERGFHVGLSGFGTGDVSLRALLELRLDFVKISGEFIREAMTTRNGRRSLTALISQAHHMACTVIAERIEAPVESQLLTMTGVDALQGFDIASPLTEQDLLAWARFRSIR